MTWILLLAASAAVVCNLTYSLGMYLESGVGTLSLDGFHPDDLLFVFLIPCLNEEKVLSATLDRLTALPLQDFMVLVIDDGSTDATFTIAETYTDPRVRVLQRALPDARRGKGAALNAGVHHLLSTEACDRAPDQVIIGLLDADGRLDPETVQAVAPYFAEPRVGGVQVGVRINNRTGGLLTRLQDMEFVAYTTIFQVAHNRLGIAGLGGNGQFTRLSALLSLSDSPWSDVLTEDLDLGVRLQLNGWWTMHCPVVAVHQQGLTSVRRLVRQRSRWFQGNLQAWKLVPQVVRRSRGRACAETLHVLLMPVLVLVSSLMVLSFAASGVGLVFSPLARAQLLHWPVMVSWYLLTFLPGALFGHIYLRRGDKLSTGIAILYGHAFILYGLLWMAAGWWAVLRVFQGRRSWLKTERLPERATPTMPADVVIAFKSASSKHSQPPSRRKA
jgi:cellulose synthase/poly-beta-1,6-N-acetylglucosamine synthase-like glycosyltransferase